MNKVGMAKNEGIIFLEALCREILVIESTR
jgi:hypothetical protein